MAKLKYGVFGPVEGHLSNLVAYIRLGEPILRMAPKFPVKKKPRTDAQKAVNLRFKTVKSFIAKMRSFTNVGFELDVAGTTRIAENGAVSANLTHAVKGEYPHFEMDYPKVVLSKGPLAGPLNPQVTFGLDLLTFTWAFDENTSAGSGCDRVMMLAYLPANNEVHFELCGAKRRTGIDHLSVGVARVDHGGIRVDRVAEVYMAFISEDRKNISNSVYLGQVLL